MSIVQDLGMDCTAKPVGEVFPRFRLVGIVQLMALQGQVTRGRHEGRVDPEVERAVLVITRHRFLEHKV